MKKGVEKKSASQQKQPPLPKKKQRKISLKQATSKQVAVKITAPPKQAKSSGQAKSKTVKRETAGSEQAKGKRAKTKTVVSEQAKSGIVKNEITKSKTDKSDQAKSKIGKTKTAGNEQAKSKIAKIKTAIGEQAKNETVKSKAVKNKTDKNGQAKTKIAIGEQAKNKRVQTKTAAKHKTAAREKKREPQKKSASTAKLSGKQLPAKRQRPALTNPVRNRNKTPSALIKKQKNDMKRRQQTSFSKKKKTGDNHLLRDLIIVLISTGLFFLLIGSVFLTIGTVKGFGMMPTFQNEDTVLIRRRTTINALDVVAFQQGNSLQIRRVIGRPGDRVSYQDDELRINGELKNEPFIIDEINQTQQNGSQYTQDFSLQELINSSTIPEDCYLVLGDNRPYAADSRSYGLITKDQIVGKVVMRILPIAEIKFF